MLGRFRSRLTYANVMATVAVFVALGGTSYAALVVTGAEVEDGSLTGADVRNNSLTGGDVRRGSLRASDFRPGELPELDPSAFYTRAEADGRYLRRTITVVASGTVTAGGFGSATAECPAGHEAIGGGVDPDGVFFASVTSSGPVFGGSRLLDEPDGVRPAATGWRAHVAIRDVQPAADFKVAAICAPVG